MVLWVVIWSNLKAAASTAPSDLEVLETQLLSTASEDVQTCKQLAVGNLPNLDRWVMRKGQMTHVSAVDRQMQAARPLSTVTLEASNKWPVANVEPAEEVGRPPPRSLPWVWYDGHTRAKPNTGLGKKTSPNHPIVHKPA